jgi:outer membrane protein assembly factor BamB
MRLFASSMNVLMEVTAVILIILSLTPAGSSAAQKYYAHQAGNEQSDQKLETAKPNQAAKTNASQPVAESGAVSTSRLAMPFKRAWRHLTEDAITLPPSVDDSRIYLPLAGGRVFCLDRQTGDLLWSAEPGGLISAPVAVSEKAVYIASRKIAENGSEAGASLRAVDKTTGLTLWVKDYARAITSPLAISHERIFAGSADGAFYALSISSGDVLWKVQTQDVVRGHALVTDRAIYFGSDDGALRVVETERGQLMWKFQTGGRIVGQPALDDRAIYFGSGDGYVYSIELATYKLRWRSRTGAAVEASPIITGGRLLVASFDNFIYCLARSNGDRLWKRRLENRIASAPITEGDATIVAPLRSDYVAVFLNADGRRVNLYQLEREYEIVADPVLSGDLLVLATNKGLVVTSIARAQDNPTSAVKK